jgi:peptidoglycan/xylan/chitin deacetylase (PgdA/CDA1 family)
VRVFFTWDDGHPDDLRLKKLHEKYKIPCMLFICAKNITAGKNTMSPDQIRLLPSCLVELGAHTYYHLRLTDVPLETAKAEFFNGKYYLEDITGVPVEHFCFPSGRFTADLVHEALFIYKTVRTSKTMRISHNFPLVDTTFHFYRYRYRMIFRESLRNHSPGLFLSALKYSADSDYFNFIKNFMIYSRNKPGDIIVWGHSWELSQQELWEELENLFRFISENSIPCGKYSELFLTCRNISGK